MMSIDEFASVLQEYLEYSNLEISKTIYRQINKNNGIKLHGIISMTKTSNIAPMIYIDDLYDKYQTGKHTVASACKQFDTMYRSAKTSAIDYDVNWFTDFDISQKNLGIKIINLKDNQNFLKDVPYFEYGDLAGIYQVRVGSIGGDLGSITITKEHMSMWGLTDRQLYESAIRAVENAEYSIKTMKDVFLESMGDALLPDEIDVSLDAMPICVLSNKEKINGAAGILRTDLLQSFAQMTESNLIVLPSSIHEVLLVPDRKMDMGMKGFIEMVTDINNSEVAVEDRLSNNAYFYDKERHELQQGEQKIPMQIKLHNDHPDRSSVLGKLKANQSKIQDKLPKPTQEKDPHQEKGR